MKNKSLKIVILLVAIVVVLASFSVLGIISTYDADIKDMVTEPDLGLDEINEEYDRIENEENKNDLLAYTILRRYGKTDATELIKDKETDCKLMEEICKMIKNDNLPQDEVEVLKKYLERRGLLLHDPETPTYENEDQLEREIYEILGWDMQYLDDK